MTHLVFVIGTRAQLVKMAPVILAAEASSVAHDVLLTGQHKESMAELAEDLGVGAYVKGADLLVEHSTMRSLFGWFPVAYLRCIRRLRRMAPAERRWVVVHGDTASTLLGALAARSTRMKVAHVESGLSSGALWNPFPEELIRRLVFRLSTICLCPDAEAVARLRSKRRNGVIDTGGNTIVDALRRAVERTAPHQADYIPNTVVVSIHRFENIMRTSRLNDVVDQVLAIADRRPVKFVLHPPTERRLVQYGLLTKLQHCQSVELLQRMPYSRFMSLLAGSYAVVTDGGSNQEELEMLGVPTIILRERTERSNGIGRNALLEANLPCGLPEYLASRASERLRHPSLFRRLSSPSQSVIDALIGKHTG